MHYILNCLESLMRQSFRDFSILVVDNGSDDGTVEFIRSNYPTVSVLQNFKNLGFSKANNQGIQLAKSEYVLVMNPDVMLDDDFLQNIISFADQNSKVGSFCGKSIKIRSEAIDQNDSTGLREIIKSDRIDSTGLLVYRSRQIIDRGENEHDRGQYDRAEEIFGVSGNCALYRKQVLEDVMIKNEFFDQDFFAYKEDIDLAWRLRLYGWSAWYCPKAICYHHRQLANYDRVGLRKSLSRRRKSSRILRQYSFRNHRLMLVKNDQPVNFLRDLPWIFWRELKIFVYALFFETFQYKSIIDFFNLLPKMLIKRKVIMAHRKVTAEEIRRWFK
jgi:GT2 family glycosyltransferase